MKLNFTKDMSKERLRGRSFVDFYYMARINDVLGDKATLYAAKYVEAKSILLANSDSQLVATDEATDIVRRYEFSMTMIKQLDDERQAFQARVDAAKSAMEIDTILSELYPEGLPRLPTRNFQ